MDEFITGRFGIVLLPDVAVDTKARELSVSIPNNEIVFNETQVPHLTLYHAELQAAPLSEIHKILQEIQSDLPQEVLFTHTAFRVSKFVFWETERTDALMKLHERALKLSQYLNRGVESPTKKEGIVLSPEQQKNVEQYGHPLVRNEWNPHITVGYITALPNVLREGCEMKGSLVRAAFAKIIDRGQAVPQF